MEKQVIQFKITLNDFEPKIWRRIQVPETYTFWDLHCAIQDAMGWTHSHLHAFSMTQKQRGRKRPISIQMPDPEWDNEDSRDEREERLQDWFPIQLKQCIYTYDFGDTWDHTVLFEKTLPAIGEKYPLCVAGQNACPPEDCGGTGGYAHLLSAIDNPQTEEDKDLREWMGMEEGERYDPTKFSVKNVVFADPQELLREYEEYAAR